MVHVEIRFSTHGAEQEKESREWIGLGEAIVYGD